MEKPSGGHCFKVSELSTSVQLVEFRNFGILMQLMLLLSMQLIVSRSSRHPNFCIINNELRNYRAKHFEICLCNRDLRGFSTLGWLIEIMSWTWKFLDLGQAGNWTHLSLNYSFSKFWWSHGQKVENGTIMVFYILKSMKVFRFLDCP